MSDTLIKLLEEMGSFHEEVARSNRALTENIQNLVMLNEDHVRQWTSGKNIALQSVGDIGRFRILLDSQRLSLGCGKVIGNELKNLLPRRLIYTSSYS